MYYGDNILHSFCITTFFYTFYLITQKKVYYIILLFIGFLNIYSIVTVIYFFIEKFNKKIYVEKIN